MDRTLSKVLLIRAAVLLWNNTDNNTFFSSSKAKRSHDDAFDADDDDFKADFQGFKDHDVTNNNKPSSFVAFSSPSASAHRDLNKLEGLWSLNVQITDSLLEVLIDNQIKALICVGNGSIRS
ncbi:hypothetical protein Tco_1253812 [Tanacetum coccineum]